MSARQVRVACVQQRQRRVASAQDWYRGFEADVAAAAAAGAGVVLFPELNTLPILSASATPLGRDAALAALGEETPRLRALLSRLAARHQLVIAGGSHLVARAHGYTNTALLALEDGRVLEQDKVHVTPNEAEAWGVAAGDAVAVIETRHGRLGIAICYDSEFPELVRHLADQGLELLLVPFLTDDRAGYLRVRHCAAARAIENQVYVALAGGVGPLEGVFNADDYWSQSAILTPSDVMFPPEAIAAEATPNAVGMIVADLDLELLALARARGTVRNLADRRQALYRRWFA